MSIIAAFGFLVGAGGRDVAVAAGPAVANLGSHEHESGEVDVVLLAVSRTSGDTVTVRWKYVNRSEEKKRLTSERTGWLDPYRLAADAYLLDTANKVKYTVLVDDSKHPIAGHHGQQNAYIVLGPKQTLATWAKFPAPAEGVTKLTVSIPGAEPFEDVPLK
ncbi:MAG: hypothetical protein PHQ91_02045 [Thermoanaerobaculaceae bacterium]|nr:hypothetical protein [Thermoanaerobaculaceae bacterium]TAM46340.1 MAG: hypothetical protein EPN53_13285 [Acidobacteriota bacterium]